MELNELRKIAEAATPGEWWTMEFEPGDYALFARDGSDDNLDVAETYRQGDAKFIATLDPPTVLALLSRLEQAELAVERVHALNNELSWSPNNVAIVQRYRDALDGEPNE